MPDSYIKVRRVGRKAWHFLSTGGSTNRLRIHALQFTREKAEALIRDNQADNPEWEWKIVPIN